MGGGARGRNPCQRPSFIQQQDTAVGNAATHTLSRSMSWLCLSLPSVVKKSLKCWIWSASSGFRLNSAGNSEIQYLEAGAKQWKYVPYVLQGHSQRNITMYYGKDWNVKLYYWDIWALCCQVIFCNYRYHNSVILSNLLLTNVKAYKIHQAHWWYKWENWARWCEHGNPTMGRNQVIIRSGHPEAWISAAVRFRM